ncbi:Thaumatin-like protein [Drosera capensis]
MTPKSTHLISFHVFYLVTLFSTCFVAEGVQLILVNNCNEHIWPTLLGSAGHPIPRDGDFHAISGDEAVIDLPEKWSGRVWGRQGCSFDSNCHDTCQTGDCSGQLHCHGLGGTPPATVVEMTFGSSRSPLHFYDVSLVDGFNLPVSMKPVGRGVASCEEDLNSTKYCCRVEYSSPQTTVFSKLFKAVCPRTYTFAFDDASSLNKCRASRYVITFCSPSYEAELACSLI